MRQNHQQNQAAAAYRVAWRYGINRRGHRETRIITHRARAATRVAHPPSSRGIAGTLSAIVYAVNLTASNARLHHLLVTWRARCLSRVDNGALIARIRLFARNDSRSWRTLARARTHRQRNVSSSGRNSRETHGGVAAARGNRRQYQKQRNGGSSM